MKYFSVLIASLLLSSFVADKPAYQLYNSKGEPIAYDKMLAQAKEADVIFFGELHNNPICHWLQIELTKDLHKEFGENVVLGAEMFEADDQLIINEYLSGVIKEKNFIEEAKLWKNYTTDYKPLIEFAKENGLTAIAVESFMTIIEELDACISFAQVMISDMGIPCVCGNCFSVFHGGMHVRAHGQ